MSTLSKSLPSLSLKMLDQLSTKSYASTIFTQLQKFDLCWMQTYSCKLLIWVVFFLYNHLSPDYKRKLPQLNILILRDLVSLKLKTAQSICTRIKLRGANYNLAICFHNRGSLLSSRGAVSIYVNNRDLPRHVQFKKKTSVETKPPTSLSALGIDSLAKLNRCC